MTTKGTILLVQAVQGNGNVTRRFLEAEGYEIVWAGSGAAALDAARKKAVDLVLLDLALPDMEGGDLYRRLRAHEETKKLPIVLIAAHGPAAMPFKGGAARAEGVLTKPFTNGELRDRVASVITKRKSPTEIVRKAPLQDGTPQQHEEDVVDSATGLFGRRQFEAMFSKEFKRAVRFKQQMSCMLIDLDGGAAGRKADEALVREIVQLVQNTIREVDTAAWWTGERFIILLPNTIRNDAVQAAARILEAVALHPFTWPDATKVAMSIGVAGLPDASIDTEQKLVEAAEAACRRAGELMQPPRLTRFPSRP